MKALELPFPLTHPSRLEVSTHVDAWVQANVNESPLHHKLIRAFYRLRDRFDRRDVSWVLHTRARRKAGHRLDHVLASQSLRAGHCDYLHGWREAGLSDHSAIEAIFEPEPLAIPPRIRAAFPVAPRGRAGIASARSRPRSR